MVSGLLGSSWKSTFSLVFYAGFHAEISSTTSFRKAYLNTIFNKKRREIEHSHGGNGMEHTNWAQFAFASPEAIPTVNFRHLRHFSCFRKMMFLHRLLETCGRELARQRNPGDATASASNVNSFDSKSPKTMYLSKQTCFCRHRLQTCRWKVLCAK